MKRVKVVKRMNDKMVKDSKKIPPEQTATATSAKTL